VDGRSRPRLARSSPRGQEALTARSPLAPVCAKGATSDHAAVPGVHRPRLGHRPNCCRPSGRLGRSRGSGCVFLAREEAKVKRPAARGGLSHIPHCGKAPGPLLVWVFRRASPRLSQHLRGTADQRVSHCTNERQPRMWSRTTRAVVPELSDTGQARFGGGLFACIPSSGPVTIGSEEKIPLPSESARPCSLSASGSCEYRRRPRRPPIGARGGSCSWNGSASVSVSTLTYFGARPWPRREN
jgi:hypothetical protein